MAAIGFTPIAVGTGIPITHGVGHHSTMAAGSATITTAGFGRRIPSGGRLGLAGAILQVTAVGRLSRRQPVMASELVSPTTEGLLGLALNSDCLGATTALCIQTISTDPKYISTPSGASVPSQFTTRQPSSTTTSQATTMW